MKKALLLSLFVLVFIGCSNNYPTYKIPPKQKTSVKEEKKEPTLTSKAISKDDHRYDERYANFNYDRLGYSNNSGGYYGYYDRDGYFYNNQYYPYNDRYRYEDRYYRRGLFDREREYNRGYIDNQWNRNHRNRGYITQPIPARVYHPREGVIEYGDISYQNSPENIKNRIDNRGY